MTVRLVVAIISTLIEEAALAVIVLLGLPRLEINMPLPGLIALMVVWLVGSVAIYQVGSRALRRKPVFNLPDMIGDRGKVVTSLGPEGLVRIQSELWVAKSVDKKIDVGAEVVIVEQDGLRLVVRKSRPDNLEEAK